MVSVGRDKVLDDKLDFFYPDQLIHILLLQRQGSSSTVELK